MAKNKFESSTNSAEQTPAPANVEKANQTDQAEKKRSIGQRAIDNLSDFAHGKSGKEETAAKKSADADNTIAEPVAPSKVKTVKAEAPKVEAKPVEKKVAKTDDKVEASVNQTVNKIKADVDLEFAGKAAKSTQERKSIGKHFASGKPVQYGFDAAKDIDLEDFAVAYMANKNLTTADYLEQVKANEAKAQAQKSLDNNSTSNNNTNTGDKADAEPTTVITGNKAQAPIPVDPLKSGDGDKGGEKKEGFFKRHWKKMMVGAVAVSLAIASYLGVKNYTANLPKAEPIEQSDKDVNNNANNDDKQSEEDKQRAAAAEQSNNEAKEWQTKADKMGLTVEDTKKFAEYYGIDLSKLCTPEAQAQMRDQRSGEYNIGESLMANGDAAIAAKEIKFIIFNNDLVLAEMMSVINTPDKAGLDGLENGTADINAYITAYQQDSTKCEADQATALDFLNNSTVSARRATDAIADSVADLGKDGKTLTVVRHAENLGGNQWIYPIVGNDGTAYEGINTEGKDECGYQLNMRDGRSATRYNGGGSSTTTNNGGGNNGGGNPGGGLTPKDNTKNSIYQSSNEQDKKANTTETTKHPAAGGQTSSDYNKGDKHDGVTDDGTGTGDAKNDVTGDDKYVDGSGNVNNVGNTGADKDIVDDPEGMESDCPADGGIQ